MILHFSMYSHKIISWYFNFRREIKISSTCKYWQSLAEDSSAGYGRDRVALQASWAHSNANDEQQWLAIGELN